MPSVSDGQPTPSRLQHQIDHCCDRFEEAWKAGQTPRLEAHLEELPETAWPDLLRELLAIEIAYRKDADGRWLSKGAFLQAHPQLAPFMDKELGKVFATEAHNERQPAGGSEPFGRLGSTRQDFHGLHIRCPHCQNPVELLADTPMEEITCGACGDTFSLVERDGQAGSVALLNRVGRFELIAQLGVGGFGTVWKALDTELDRVVALKIPRKGQLSPQETEQFFREARAAAQIQHPNIVPVHEVGRDDDTVFIVTDLIHGVSLAARLQDDPHSAREAAALCATIADSLHFAHQQGVIHRDLKPSNVMIDERGQPHLMDFGLAKREIGEVTMTVEGQILGTPAYMSPEQALGQTHWIDRRTDVYSLGVVLFQLLTQELPFRGGVQRQIQQRILEDAPSPRKLNAHVPIDLATICLKCLERDPNRRYGTAGELADELRRFLRGEPIQARPISRAERTWRWAKRKPALATAAALTVFLAVAGPLAAVVIESGRRDIQAQLEERIETIAMYERKIDEQSGKFRALQEEHDGLLGADLRLREITPGWRKRLISDYLEQHGSAIEELLQGRELTVEQQARIRVGVAYMSAATDRRNEALQNFEAAANLLASLTRRHPDVERFRVALADCFMEMSLLQRARGQKELARVSVERALGIREALARNNPANPKHQINFSDSFAWSLVDNKSREKQRRMRQVINQTEQSWQTSPAALYELACYLTFREPLLTNDRNEPSAEPE